MAASPFGIHLAREGRLAIEGVALDHPLVYTTWSQVTSLLSFSDDDRRRWHVGSDRASARVLTRLADPGETISKQLVNWGYAVCDRCVRQYYLGYLLNRSPEWPFGDASL
jgi:hypothetical protein